MSNAMLVPLLLGAAGVLQATLNREIAATWGLAPTCVLNMLVALCLALGFVAVAHSQGGRGEDAELLRVAVRWQAARWWWLLPGVFGFGLVAGLPWSVARLGALPVFVAVVAAQMVASLAWDALVQDVSVSWSRALGGLLAVASVALVSWR